MKYGNTETDSGGLLAYTSFKKRKKRTIIQNKTRLGILKWGAISCSRGCHFLLQEIFQNQGVEPKSFASPESADGFFTTSVTWKVQDMEEERGRIKRKSTIRKQSWVNNFQWWYFCVRHSFMWSLNRNVSLLAEAFSGSTGNTGIT